ncbi:TIGR00366 family protein [Synergistaceae bacterium OttesenSCG-928-D05]|nr:TIGR00366 family protein [Synergistaceae bacterium OttesenSCG-928-D05]
MSEKKKEFQMPHTFVILFIIMLIAAAATYIVPSGSFNRVPSNIYSWLKLIDPSSFHYTEQTPVGFFQFFICIFQGLVQVADIIFFTFICYSYVYLVSSTGAINGFSNALLKKTKGKEILVLPIFIIFFGICGSTFGMIESTYGLIPIFVGIATAMGYDAIVGISMVGLAAATGFASATTNPFTVGVAQSIAGLPLFSGIGYRVAVFIVFQIAAIAYVMRYAAKIKKDPTKSVLHNVEMETLQVSEETANQEFTTTHKILLCGFLFMVVMLVLGGVKLGWGIPQMSGLFLVMLFASGAIARYSPNKIAETIVTACSKMVFGALVIGVARGVLVVMNAGGITDTIIYGLAKPLESLPTMLTAQVMLLLQNMINLVIPSGSGQAATTIPIMAPLSDLIGINRQIIVLAFQFGDGYSNLLWPTASGMIMCAVAKVPFDKWLKFFLPLFGIYYVLQMIFVAAAVMFNYGPF